MPGYAGDQHVLGGFAHELPLDESTSRSELMERYAVGVWTDGQINPILPRFSAKGAAVHSTLEHRTPAPLYMPHRARTSAEAGTARTLSARSRGHGITPYRRGAIVRIRRHGSARFTYSDAQPEQPRLCKMPAGRISATLNNPEAVHNLERRKIWLACPARGLAGELPARARILEVDRLWKGSATLRGDVAWRWRCLSNNPAYRR